MLRHGKPSQFACEPLALPLLWVAFAIKYLKEERAMRQTFGEQYIEYSQTTGAIFPSLMRQ